MFSGGFFDFSVLVMTMMKMTSLSVSMPWMATVLAVPEADIVTEICQVLIQKLPNYEDTVCKKEE